jgi:hypothetical protein
MVRPETNRWAAHALVDTLVHEGRPEHEIAVAADESAAALRVLVADDEPMTRLDLAGVLAEATASPPLGRSWPCAMSRS